MHYLFENNCLHNNNIGKDIENVILLSAGKKVFLYGQILYLVIYKIMYNHI